MFKKIVDLNSTFSGGGQVYGFGRSDVGQLGFLGGRYTVPRLIAGAFVVGCASGTDFSLLWTG